MSTFSRYPTCSISWVSFGDATLTKHMVPRNEDLGGERRSLTVLEDELAAMRSENSRLSVHSARAFSLIEHVRTMNGTTRLTSALSRRAS